MTSFSALLMSASCFGVLPVTSIKPSPICVLSVFMSSCALATLSRSLYLRSTSCRHDLILANTSATDICTGAIGFPGFVPMALQSGSGYCFWRLSPCDEHGVELVHLRDQRLSGAAVGVGLRENAVDDLRGTHGDQSPAAAATHVRISSQAARALSSVGSPSSL